MAPFAGTPPDETFTRTTGFQTGTTAWADTETAGRGIEAVDQDVHDQDVATAINSLLKRDGGNKPTADIPWGGKKITDLADPVSGTDAANKDYVDATATGFENFTVRVATTADGTLATAFDDASTVDGVTLATNDLILLKNQTAADENGVYVVQASGAPARSTSFDTWDEHVGSIINVTEGTANAGLSFRCTVNTGGTLETTDITYAQFGSNVVLPLPIGSGGTGQTTAALAFNALKQAATDAATGVVELATSAETVTGTDTARATTPAGVKAAIAAGSAPTRAAKTSSQSVTATSMTNVTSLSFSIGVNETWVFMGTLSFSAETTGNKYLSVNGPASPSSVSFMVAAATAAQASGSGSAEAAGISTYDGDIEITDEDDTHGLASFSGTVANGSNAGTVIIRARVAAGTLSIKGGHIMAWRSA